MRIAAKSVGWGPCYVTERRLIAHVVWRQNLGFPCTITHRNAEDEVVRPRRVDLVHLEDFEEGLHDVHLRARITTKSSLTLSSLPVEVEQAASLSYSGYSSLLPACLLPRRAHPWQCGKRCRRQDPPPPPPLRPQQQLVSGGGGGGSALAPLQPRP